MAWVKLSRFLTNFIFWLYYKSLSFRAVCFMFDSTLCIFVFAVTAAGCFDTFHFIVWKIIQPCVIVCAILLIILWGLKSVCTVTSYVE